MAILTGLVVAGRREAVPLQTVSISVSVHGFLANVEACLKYTNSESTTHEVTYVFPMDDNSAVYRCEADIDGRHIVAEIQEKEQARETYEEAVTSGHSALLMEEHDTAGDIFRCKLGNLPPNSDAVIKFAFVTELEQETDGSLKFVLPTVLNPRYNPSREDGGTDEDMSLLAMNSSYYQLEFNGNVTSKHGIARVWSNTEKLTTSLVSGLINTMKIGLAEPFTSTHNLTFSVLYDETHKPQITFAKGKEGEPGSLLTKDLLMLSFYPDLSNTHSSATAEFIFIIDRSGSMMGKSIKNAKEAILFFLKSLPVDCFFNIVSFGDTHSVLFPNGSQRYGESTLMKAMDLLPSIEADMGGTEILRPLEFVFRQKAQPGYPRQVFLLTDGEVSNTSEVVALVKRNSYSTRVFTVGIGHGVSTSLVRNVAKAGGGQAEFVTGNDKLQEKVMKLLKAACQPAVTDLNLAFNLPEDHKIDVLLPKNIPVIFDGQRCTMFAFMTGSVLSDSSSSGKAKLTGKVQGEEFTHTVAFDLNAEAIVTSGQFVHRMAIKEVIKDLEMEEKDSVVDKKREIIVASTAGNIISKYTSFVGVDKEKNEKTEEIRPPHVVSEIFGSSWWGSLLSSDSEDEYYDYCGNVDRCSYGYVASVDVDYNQFCDNDENIYEDIWEDTLQTTLACSNYQPSRSNYQPSCSAEGSLHGLSLNAGALVLLQAFDGSWPLSEELATIVGVTKQTLDQKANIKDKKIWATCVSICWLKLKCPDERPVWEMVVNKARSWLIKQLGGETKVDELLKVVQDSVFSS